MAKKGLAMAFVDLEKAFDPSTLRGDLVGTEEPHFICETVFYGYRGVV